MNDLICLKVKIVKDVAECLWHQSSLDGRITTVIVNTPNLCVMDVSCREALLRYHYYLQVLKQQYSFLHNPTLSYMQCIRVLWET